MPTPAPTARLAELDALRGLAAGAVVLYHHLLCLPAVVADTRAAGLASPLNVVKYTPLHLIWAGPEAVSFFFVLSGFVLAIPFFGARPPAYRPYLVRRACRLYLPYIVAVVGGLAARLALARPGAAPPGLDPLIGECWQVPLTARSLLGHMLPVLPFDGRPIVPVVWTLAVEARVAIVFPAIAWAVLRLPTPVALGLALAVGRAGPLVAPMVGDPGSTPSLISVTMFVAGAALAKHRAWLVDRLAALPAPARAAVWATIPALLTLGDWLPRAPLPTPTLAAILGASLLIVASLASPAAGRWLARPALQRLGAISYSLYLWHMVVLLAALHGLGPHLPLWACLATSMALGPPVSWLMHRAVEQPSIALGRRLTSNRPAAPTLNPSPRRPAPRPAARGRAASP